METYDNSLRRTNDFVYAANLVDLVTHYGPSGEFLAGYGYNDHHQMTKFTNAVGEVWTYNYDQNTHQLGSIEKPSGLTTWLTYYQAWEGASVGRLKEIEDQQIQATRTLTYTNDLVHTATDARDLTVTYAWDKLTAHQRHLSGSIYIERVYNRLRRWGK